MEKKFERNTFGKRLGSMLRVDFRHMFKTPLFYIFLGIIVVLPAVILIMTTMMDGQVNVDPNTGKETVTEGFDYVWQIIGTPSTAGGSGSAGGMDLVSMCNINLLYFGIAVLVCLFVSSDFRSGYSKNLFAVRAKKSDYIISKIITCFTASAILVVGFFLGSVVGGAIAGLPFTMNGFNVYNIIMCMLAKLFLMAVFVSIYVAVSVVVKQRAWLGMIASFAVSMLLFTMIPMITPLDATIVHAGLCLGGGALAALGLGSLGGLLLKKIDII